MPSKVLIVSVSNEERFGGERIRLHVYIGPGDFVQETGLSHVGISAQDESSCVGIDAALPSQCFANLQIVRSPWKTSKMLSNLLQVSQTWCLLPYQSAHPKEAD